MTLCLLQFNYKFTDKFHGDQEQPIIPQPNIQGLPQKIWMKTGNWCEHIRTEQIFPKHWTKWANIKIADGVERTSFESRSHQ